ncbi:protein-tyrosine phosphatase-like protein [Gymnopilus junonius]|uniref:protein-tyrosine-phosphatase n=1 Tax=Gymnopilus junonius TaxID=109634 RepID=A0A9P5P1P9_GYMJU|nr:protein-tyrosine phosphatase-like protein [Gymnopilus junonius]
MSSNQSISKDTNAPVFILAPYLYLGPRTAASPASVRANDFTHVLTIGSTSPPKGPHTNNVIYRRIPLSHYPSSERIKDAIDIANNFIESTRALKNGKVLVHCTAGVSRSPTIIVVYLMRAYGMSLKDALGMVIRARPSANPNQVLLQRLKEVEVTFRGKSSLEIDVLPTKKSERLALFSLHDV